MADRLSPERRSWLMSRVKSRDTGPEIRVRKAAHAMGLRFRLYRKDLPGSPDLVFPGRKVAMFVHGCFWHRHEGCKKTTDPKSQTEFWQEKFARNVARDRQNAADLEALGWSVFVIWQCDTTDAKRLDEILYSVLRPDRSLNRQSVKPEPDERYLTL